MGDAFFTKTECDRCGGPLDVRTASWFTPQTICLECSGQEQIVKQRLKDAGHDPAAFEGCGYIPRVENLPPPASLPIGRCVIVRNDGRYVSKPGSAHSYTTSLACARKFSGAAEALRHKCGNETIVALAPLLAEVGG